MAQLQKHNKSNHADGAKLSPFLKKQSNKSPSLFIAICIRFILFPSVKGNFYKVEDHEYAFVIWSGESELNYNARKLDGFKSTIQLPLKLFIEKNESFLESVEFITGKNGKYEFGNPSSLSTINFVKADLKDSNRYIKEYPGNN